MGGCILRLFQGIHPLLSLITSERWAFRALKMRPVRQVLLLARYASENASRTPGGCPQSVDRLFCGTLKMRRVPQKAVFGTEYLFRTVEACFWYGALPKTHRTWLSGAQASCYRCGTSNLTKERGRPFGRPPLK